MTTEAEKELLLRVAASIDGDMDDRLNNSFVRADGLVTRLFVGPITVAEARTIARVLREAAEGWIKITCANDLPKKPGKERYEYVECLIFHKGEIKMRPWNCEHLCWDDEEHDDFFCDAMEPSHYMKLPAPPSETTR